MIRKTKYTFGDYLIPVLLVAGLLFLLLSCKSQKHGFPSSPGVRCVLFDQPIESPIHVGGPDTGLPINIYRHESHYEVDTTPRVCEHQYSTTLVYGRDNTTSCIICGAERIPDPLYHHISFDPCDHSIINIISTKPLKTQCFLCGETLIDDTPKSCDHFYVAQYLPADSRTGIIQSGLCICIHCNQITVCP